MGLLIHDGEILTATERYVADIYCEAETITAIGRDLPSAPGDRVIDATGKLVFPGGIDPHVHFALPVAGTVSKDDFETGTIAALAGGTTCVLDFVNPSRADSPLEFFEIWNRKAEGKAAVDYGFHLAVPRFDSETKGEILELIEQGISSVKVYLAYRPDYELPDDELYYLLELAKKRGLLTMIHAENGSMVECEQKRLIAEGKTTPIWHCHSRKDLVEGEGVRHAATMARFHDAPLYIVHTSCRDALEAAYQARFRGQHVFVETCPQYLFLDESYCDTEDFEGAKYILSPPLRHSGNQQYLWAGLSNGAIQTVATDHCSFDFGSQKVMGKGDFTKIPNGLPSVEDRLTLLWTYGVGKGRISANRFVELTSTNAAKLFGLYPRKGTIELGADADLVVFDPEATGVISAATQKMNVDYNPYEGWAYKGKAEIVTVRGQVAFEDGELVGTLGRGRFLKRQVRHEWA